MPDPQKTAAEPARPPESAPTLPTVPPLVDDGVLAPGKRWHGYRITSPIADGFSRVFNAADIASMENVVIRAIPLTDVTEWDRSTWAKLQELPRDGLVGRIEAREENGFRYEITAAPPEGTLREWMSCHQADAAMVGDFSRQMATILQKLHSHGIVHLHLRPDNVHVNVLDDGIEVVLGGLHQATLFDQPQLIEVEVDPFYAPPEAEGLFKHSPGPGLCAWDWWSLGRLAQELILGRHVLGYFLDRDVTSGTPELRARAEALLLEKEPEGVRAGAIELMPKLDTMISSILRGLLTGSRDGRWNGDNLQRRLAGEPVKDHYDLPKNERLFVWNHRAFTIHEAAEHFATAVQWQDGEANLFADPADPTALINFLQAVPAYRPEAQRIKAVLARVDTPVWQDLPLTARRTAVAALAWRTLAGSASKMPFGVRGQRMDQAGLQVLLTTGPAVEAVGLLRTLIARPMVQLVESIDATAARSLAVLACSMSEALQQAEKRGWIAAGDATAQARLFSFALEPGKELEERLARLRTDYASNRDADLATGLASAKPEPWMAVLLAYTGESPAKFGYVTHAQRNREQHEALLLQGRRLAAAVFWQRIGRVLSAGPLLFGPWWLFIPAWSALAAAVFALVHSATWPLIAATALIGFRLLGWIGLRRLVRNFDATAAPWTWRDRAGRCWLEARRVYPEGENETSRAIARRFGAVSREMAQLALTTSQSTLPAQPRCLGLWAGVGASHLALAAALGAIVIIPELRRAALEEANARSVAAAKLKEAKAGPTPLQPPPGSPPGLYEEADDGFGRYLRGPLQTWDLPVPAVVPPLAVQRQVPATSQQSAYAVVSGELLLRPYPRLDLDAVLAVRVPVPGETGLMLYDGRERKILARRVMILATTPDDRSWYLVDGRSVIYLGVPPTLEQDLTVASQKTRSTALRR